MFTTRLISGVILVIIALFTVGSGGILLFATTISISMIGLFELYRVMKIQKNPLGFMGYLTALSYYGLIWFHGDQYKMLMSIAFLMILMSIYVFAFPRYQMEEVTVAFFGVFYVAVMLSYLYQVRTMADGKYLVWLVFLSSWGV
jgi:phosphatidate cytidylyltransferase